MQLSAKPGPALRAGSALFLPQAQGGVLGSRERRGRQAGKKPGSFGPAQRSVGRPVRSARGGRAQAVTAGSSPRWERVPPHVGSRAAAGSGRAPPRPLRPAPPATAQLAGSRRPRARRPHPPPRRAYELREAAGRPPTTRPPAGQGRSPGPASPKAAPCPPRPHGPGLRLAPAGSPSRRLRRGEAVRSRGVEPAGARARGLGKTWAQK
ncbi:PREDICTED: atherin-like [Chinchilla lanigera]|uniref:atherin-like n=1 Tax=Chinchilla lanigera TaxID=34839 RepID=UPI00038EFE05|nr:PREDICTED: atherin-like [Chinchilla lanigera]XP_005389412.1 PREDICTED: atherin-like [Chinchilla lanigera]